MVVLGFEDSSAHFIDKGKGRIGNASSFSDSVRCCTITLPYGPIEIVGVSPAYLHDSSSNRYQLGMNIGDQNGSDFR